MKQSEMAEILGIKERSYQCYEYRERYPDVPGLVAIADFFDVSLDYLMGHSDLREETSLKKLCSAYRGLSITDRRTVMDFMEFLVQKTVGTPRT